MTERLLSTADTSRTMRELEEDGMGYWFVSRDEMEHDIRDHQFLECGEHNGHLYGTKLDSIRSIIRQGKMCVLDCSPNVSANFLIMTSIWSVSTKYRISSSTAGPENPSQFTGIHAFRHIPSGSGHGPTQGAIRELPLF